MRTIYQFARKSISKLIAIFALLFFTTQNAKAVCNLQASFTYVEGISNTVEFTNTTVGATSLHWDFGNGATSTVFNPTIQFQQDAFYDVCLIARDSNSCVDTTCQSLTIGAPCFHNNPTINHVIDITDSISQICSFGGGNCFQDNFIILDSANNGIITQSGINCFLYKPQSLGVDTIRVITCSLPILPNNCDTTTHIINVLQRSECNRITDDTIRLEIQNGSAIYCSPFVYDRYFVLNNNSYYGYSLCSPNNLQLTFNAHGFYNITIIDSTNNCFENVVFDVIDSLVIRSCATSSSLVLIDTFYNNDLNIPRAYCLPLVCQLRRIQTQHGVLQHGNLNVDQNGCIFYTYTSFGSDSFYITLSDSNSSIQDTFYFYFFGIDSFLSLCDTTTCLPAMPTMI